MNAADLGLFVPLFVALGGLESYFFAKLVGPAYRRWTGTMAAVWLLAAFGLLLIAVDQGFPTSGGSVFAPILQPSYLGLIVALLATGLGALAALASQGRIEPDGPVHLYYPLLLFALAGASAVGFANDLFTLFVLVELGAIPSYALVAYRYKQEPRSLSAALKYLVQGVAGTVTALFGVALLYLASSRVAGHGTLAIRNLQIALGGADPLLLGLAATLILIGYGVKLGIVPLHTWLPDAYTHAPGGVTAIMAGATKAGALVALIVSLSVLPPAAVSQTYLGAAVSVLAVLTMTVGNLLALNQKDLRRVLAYSSVAQMGYILLGFGIGIQYSLALGFEAGLFYAIAYSVMKGGAFLAADAFTAAAGSPEVAKMRGLGARHPVVGVAFTIFILGLVGVPATAGFLGKLLVFQAGMATHVIGGVVLALILAANSALSLGYYVPILSTLLFQGHEAEHATPAAAADGGEPSLPLSTSASVVALAAVTVYLGLFPQVLFDWIANATQTLTAFWGVH
ncbi:MAG TPA: NADH-quinone oxidoreductase subunit N [Thermoplasmata archaeon]|nr:NADH-quinone oxidoreductase subunit N [Thermoplasmata archaeon]